jgi:hypothetical protein
MNPIEFVALLQRPYPANPQYSYSNWSPPAQSNDTTNGYFLERSNSARKTLEKAIELCPEAVSLLVYVIDGHVLTPLLFAGAGSGSDVRGR